MRAYDKEGRLSLGVRSEEMRPKMRSKVSQH